MKRKIATPGPACAGGILFLLVGIVALSAATRRPYLRPGGGSWHLCKAGHFSESEGPKGLAIKADTLSDDPQPQTEAPLSAYVPCEEVLAAALALTVHEPYFRPPPSLP